jgi:capsular polysaccharide biosynthesis protein
MIRYILIAILLYLAYLIIRSVLRNILDNKVKKQSGAEKKSKRTYNLNDAEDAEFREVNKD